MHAAFMLFCDNILVTCSAGAQELEVATKYCYCRSRSVNAEGLHCMPATS